MVYKEQQSEFQEMSRKIDAGIQKAYQKLVEKKAKEGGYLIQSVDGKITKVPAIELLKTLKKSA